MSASGMGGAGQILAVRIDDRRCEGHARCWALCPEVFDVDDSGYAHVRDDADLEAHADKVVRAALNCPERAIEVVRST